MATRKKAAPAPKIKGTEEAWEAGELGRDEAYVAESKSDLDLDESLELQMISIRLPKSLIEDFKIIAKYHGNHYQPLMRQILKRFADAETKNILREMASKGELANGKDSVETSMGRTAKTRAA